MVRKPHAVGLRWKNKHTGALATLVAQDRVKVNQHTSVWVFTLEYDEGFRRIFSTSTNEIYREQSRLAEKFFYQNWEVTDE